MGIKLRNRKAERGLSAFVNSITLPPTWFAPSPRRTCLSDTSPPSPTSIGG